MIVTPRSLFCLDRFRPSGPAKKTRCRPLPGQQVARGCRGRREELTTKGGEPGGPGEPLPGGERGRWGRGLGACNLCGGRGSPPTGAKQGEPAACCRLLQRRVRTARGRVQSEEVEGSLRLRREETLLGPPGPRPGASSGRAGRRLRTVLGREGWSPGRSQEGGRGVS